MLAKTCISTVYTRCCRSAHRHEGINISTMYLYSIGNLDSTMHELHDLSRHVCLLKLTVDLLVKPGIDTEYRPRIKHNSFICTMYNHLNIHDTPSPPPSHLLPHSKLCGKKDNFLGSMTVCPRGPELSPSHSAPLHVAMLAVYTPPARYPRYPCTASHIPIHHTLRVDRTD